MKVHRLTLLFILMGLVLSACRKDNKDYNFYNKGFVKVNRSSVSLRTGESVTITPSFYSDEVRDRGFSWIPEDPAIISVVENDDLTATVTALKEGNTRVKIVANNNEISATCEVVVSNADGIIRILGIGNSFTEDATQNFLYELATAAGRQVVVAHLYIGGSSLEDHLYNATNNLARYEYRKIDEHGVYTNVTGKTLAEAVTDQRWDYISFQEQSERSGIFSYYEQSLPGLVAYVKARAVNPSVVYMMHRTWAYAQNATNPGFANYNNDQMTMYNAIVNAVSQAADLVDIHKILPVGTAIQNGRTSVVGDHFNRDGYHLDLGIGRFTAACTWFEEIFGSNVVNNPYKPDIITDYQAEIAKHAAHLAVQNPNTVTEMVDYQQPENPGNLLANPVYIDFGGWCDNGSLQTWNEFKSFTGGSMDNLIDNQGANTSISIAVTKRFKAVNWNGGGNPTLPGWTIPHYSVAYDGFYGTTTDEGTSELVISGLDASQELDLSAFGSYFSTSYDPGPQNPTADNRETSYTFKGATEQTVTINASNNLTSAGEVNNIKADAGGKIVITVKKGSNNNTANGSFYLNALRIAPAN